MSLWFVSHNSDGPCFTEFDLVNIELISSYWWYDICSFLVKGWTLPHGDKVKLLPHITGKYDRIYLFVSFCPDPPHVHTVRSEGLLLLLLLLLIKNLFLILKSRYFQFFPRLCPLTETSAVCKQLEMWNISLYPELVNQTYVT